MSARDYPEHLNPFDDNYTGAEAATSHSRHKYNTWSHRVTTSTVANTEPKLLKKSWAALNISPNGKLVRRLSILKRAVDQFATKKTRFLHSTSLTESDLPPRSHSVHDDFSFRIISPKLKEKIRQQAFSQSINKQTQLEADTITAAANSTELNGRLSPQKLQIEEESLKLDNSVSPESEKEIKLGARPKTRKKRPPPPPPIDAPKIANLVLQSNDEKAEDSHSTTSSITQELEKDATSEEESSKIEVCETRIKKTDKDI